MHKKILDLIAGMVGCLIFLLLCPLIGLAIKLDSPGPVFFKQKRVGLRGRNFILYKFRSMRVTAEEEKAALLKKVETPWPLLNTKEDPRVTRVGRFLRKTSLDEFPQFINVLKKSNLKVFSHRQTIMMISLLTKALFSVMFQKNTMGSGL